MKYPKALRKITILIVLLIISIVFVAKMNQKSKEEISSKAYISNLLIKGEYLNESENNILKILLMTVPLSSFQSDLGYKYYQFLLGYLSRPDVELKENTVYKVEEKMNDMFEIINLEEKNKIEEMSIDCRQVAISIREDIYKSCGLKLVHNYKGDIQKVIDGKGNSFNISEKNNKLEVFDFTIFLIILVIWFLLLCVCLYISKKNHLYKKEERYELN